MESTELEPDQAVTALSSALDGLGSLDLDRLDPAALLSLLPTVERCRRRLEAQTARLVGSIDSSGAYGVDGHLTPTAAIKHLARTSPAEAGRMVSRGRTVAAMPTLAEKYTAGEIPTGHVDVVARARANPRATDAVVEADEWFAHHATDLAHDPFAGVVRQFERLADEDGAHLDAERRHRRRQLTIRPDYEGGISGHFRLGDLQGAVFSQALAAYERAEFLADWEQAQQTHGDNPPLSALARTPTQRRVDAVVAMARNSLNTRPDDVAPESSVDIVMDWDTFKRELAREHGLPTEPVDPTTADRVICRTIDGTPLPPGDAVEAALMGHVRRVVVGGPDVGISLGRKRRLFTGAARDAVRLSQPAHQQPGCDWLDCGAPASICEIDHRKPWRLGGATTVDNGRLSCGRHNRLKETGFCVTVDDQGRPLITRPDGTPVTNQT